MIDWLVGWLSADWFSLGNPYCIISKIPLECIVHIYQISGINKFLIAMLRWSNLSKKAQNNKMDESGKLDKLH